MILLLIVCINVLFLYPHYDNLLFIFTVPLISCGMGLISLIIWGYFLEDTSREPLDESDDLLPVRRFLSGLFFPLLFAWDDILLQSDELVKPWFWSMMICAYTGWILGVVILRNYRIKKKSEIEESPPKKPDEPFDELFG